MNYQNMLTVDEIAFENWVLDLQKQENYNSDKEVIRELHILGGC